MKRASRPKPRPTPAMIVAALCMALPGAALAQVSSTYATRDGRVPATVLTCAALDGSFTAQPCGVSGAPMHVQVDGAATAGTSSAGTASGQLQGVQGGGAGALPVAVSQSGGWTLTLPSGSHLALDAGGNVIGAVAQSGAWTVAVSNLPATQAITAAALPLPSGAATAANQAAIATDGGGQVHVMNLPATQVVSGSVTIGNLPATQAISAAALPLPAGAATAANQAAINTDGGSLVHVMNLPATQAVSGSVTVGNLPATQAIAAAALPLPTGAATAANQAAINTDGGSQVHVMNLPTTQPVSGSISVSNLPSTQAVSGTVSVGNLPATQAVSVSTLPLPSGAATAANQAAINTDGGSLVHVMNLPATQAISASALPLPSGAATAANQAAINGDGGSQVHLMNALPAGANTIGTVVPANRSGAWTDASLTASATAAVPSALAAVSARTGLHVWNVGSAMACLNYTGTAAVSGSGCAAGSVPIPAGSAYLEDQPGNVSPEAISLVCTTSACPLTIKVR